MTVAFGDFAREHGTDGAVDVADRHINADFFAALQRRFGEFDQAVIQRLVETVVLRFAVEARDFGAHFRLVENTAEIEAAGFPVFDAWAGVEQVGTADQVIKLADAELRHQLADFLGDKKEVIDDVFRLAGEFLAQHRILGGNTHRTGVEVAFAHHDAALDHQRRGGKAELVGAEQRADDDIAAGFELAVDLHRYAAAQAVQHQRLLGFGQAEFPRRAGVFD